MIPAIGDTLDGRYTLIAQYRTQPGVSAWIARDHALDLDCQIFLLTDETRIQVVSQIASALVLSHNPRSTVVRRFHSVDDALLVVMEPDPGVALSTLIGPDHHLSFAAMRMVANELIDTIRSLHSSQVDFHTLVPEVIRLTSSSLLLSAVPLDPYIDPPLVTRARQTSTSAEMLAILQISAVLYQMLTGVSFDPHRMEAMNETLFERRREVQAEDDDIPSDFLTILERALGVRLHLDGTSQRPFPIYTLMEMQALLDNPLRPAQLQEDLQLPKTAGTASVSLVHLLPSDQQDIVDIPDSLISTDTVHNESGVMQPWSRQELFAGTDVQEVDPSTAGLLGSHSDSSDDDHEVMSSHNSRDGRDSRGRQNGADSENGRIGANGRTSALNRSDNSTVGEVVGAHVQRGPASAASAVSPVSSLSTGSSISAASFDAQSATARSGSNASAGGFAHGDRGRQSGSAYAGSASSNSTESAYRSEAVNEVRAEESAHTQTVVDHHELSAADSHRFEQKEQLERKKKEHPRRVAQGIVIGVAALALIIGTGFAINSVKDSFNITLPWSKRESDAEIGKNWSIDASEAPLPGNARQEAQEEKEDASDESTQSSHSSKKSGAKKSQSRVTARHRRGGVIIDDKNASAVPKPVQPITNPVSLPFTQQFFTNAEGRGIALTLSGAHRISTVTITLRGAQSAGTGKLYVDSTVSDPRHGKPVASFTFAGGNQPTKIDLPSTPSTQNLVIWVDKAPTNGLYYSNLSVMGEGTQADSNAAASGTTGTAGATGTTGSNPYGSTGVTGQSATGQGTTGTTGQNGTNQGATGQSSTGTATVTSPAR